MLGMLTAAIKAAERVMKEERLGTRGACCSWVELFQKDSDPHARWMCHYQNSYMGFHGRQYL
jgi:hypothetical protein